MNPPKSVVYSLAAVGAMMLGLAGQACAQLLINGAGATFPYPIYSKWFDEYAKVDASVRFNYQSIGSGGGQKQILAETVDFGASDGPMSDENLARAPGKLLHIPTVAGAVVVTYNMEGEPKLKLDGETIVDIFRGKIAKWNDRRIAGPESRPPIACARYCGGTPLGWQRHDVYLHGLFEYDQPFMARGSGQKHIHKMARGTGRKGQ